MFPRSTSDKREASRGLEGVILLDEAIIYFPFAYIGYNSEKIEQDLYSLYKSVNTESPSYI